MNWLPSTSSITAPSARAAKIGVEWYGPRGTAASRRFINSRDFGPGICVRNCMVAISVSFFLLRY